MNPRDPYSINPRPRRRRRPALKNDPIAAFHRGLTLGLTVGFLAAAVLLGGAALAYVWLTGLV